VLQDKIARFLGQDQRTARAESYEERRILLKVGEAAAIPIRENWRDIS
jgi:hypothetical protein